MKKILIHIVLLDLMAHLIRANVDILQKIFIQQPKNSVTFYSKRCTKQAMNGMLKEKNYVPLVSQKRQVTKNKSLLGVKRIKNI